MIWKNSPIKINPYSYSSLNREDPRTKSMKEIEGSSCMPILANRFKKRSNNLSQSNISDQ